MVKDFEKMVHKLAWKWWKSAFYSFESQDDLIQEAWCAIYRNISKNRIDEKKGKASSYLYTAIECTFKDIIKRKNKKWNDIDFVDDSVIESSLFDTDVYSKIEQKLWVEEILSNLSDSAREVAEVILDNNDFIGIWDRNRSPKSILRLVSVILDRDIKKDIKEIKMVLNAAI